MLKLDRETYAAFLRLSKIRPKPKRVSGKELEKVERTIARATSPRYMVDARERRALDARGMKLAEKYLKGKRYKFENVSAKRPYDFHASREGRTFYVEVKTSSTDDPVVHLTAGEVKLHENDSPERILLLVKNVRLEGRGTGHLRAFGGVLTPHHKWTIRHGDLVPTQYIYRAP